MPTSITTKAQEESSYTITAAFTDEAGAEITPNADTITWTLSDINGTTINSKSSQAISSDASVDIVLSGEDLAITETGSIVKRILTVEAEYDSDKGSDLKLKDSAHFQVENLQVIT